MMLFINQKKRAEIASLHTLQTVKSCVIYRPHRGNLPDAPNGEAIDSGSVYNIPIIVLTGSVDNNLREIIFQKQIVEFISKNDINNITYAASVCKRILKNYDTNVLIVDDSSTFRMLLTRQLKKLHINVLEAVNPIEAIKIIVKKAHRNQSPVLVAMLDIDHFKLINDTYGHDVGDIAIKEVASILKQSVRSSDLISRFGGEEFCLLLENISMDEARELLENIRIKFESNIIQCQNNAISYTVSIGAFYGNSSDIEAMIKDADLNLYEAKENGRNKVVLKFPQ